MRAILFVTLLVAVDAGGSPALTTPIAICDKGICTMSEADYLMFRKFHSAVIANAIESKDIAEKLAASLEKARNIAVSCLHRRA